MFVIEICKFINNSQPWALDIDCGSNIRNNVQGLSDSKKVKYEEMELHIKNGARVVVIN